MVGRGGLLGRHVDSAMRASNRGAETWQPLRPVPWEDPMLASLELERELTRFFSRAEQCGALWHLMWCAGAGVVATSPETLARETAVVRGFVADVRRQLTNRPRLGPRGTVFFTSSAGAVYAASQATQPFQESSPVRALGAYGRQKLVQEALFAALFEQCGVDVLIGRFSNLYGPGQDLTKPQGLVAHIGQAALRREAISIYVPLDTIRDYLFAADAGQMVVKALARRRADRDAGSLVGTVTKIFATEVETTVASVLGAWRQVLRRPLRVSLAASPVSQIQPRVLSFRSSVWPEIRGRPTLLTAGIDAVRRDQLLQLTASGGDRTL